MARPARENAWWVLAGFGTGVVLGTYLISRTASGSAKGMGRSA